MTTPPDPGQTVAGQPGDDAEAPGPDATDGAVTGYQVPVARPPKPRLLQDGRDMFWSIGPLVLACVLLAGAARHVFVRTDGPRPGPAPDYDAAAALQADADALAIPIRVPELPPGWHSNSGRRKGIENGRTDPVSGQPIARSPRPSAISRPAACT